MIAVNACTGFHVLVTPHSHLNKQKKQKPSVLEFKGAYITQRSLRSHKSTRVPLPLEGTRTGHRLSYRALDFSAALTHSSHTHLTHY